MIQIKKSLFQLFLKDTFFYILIKGIISFTWVFTLKFYTTSLTPEIYGNYSIIQSILTYGLVFSSAWIAGPILRFLPAYQNNIAEFKKTLGGLIFLSATIGSVLFASTLIFSLKKMSLNWDPFLIFLVVGSFYLNTYEACFYAYFRAERSVFKYAKIYSVQIILAFLVSIFCIKYLNLKIHGIFLGQFISLIAVLPFFKGIHLIYFKFYPTSLSSEMLKYGAPLLFINLFTQILSSVDQMILKFYGMNQEVGIYSANYMLAQNTIFAFTSLLSAALAPILFQNWEKGSKQETLSFLKKMAYLYCGITFPFVLILSLFKEDITRLFISSDYYSGIQIVPYVAFGAFFVGLGNVFSELLTIYKKTFNLMICYAIAALFNIVFNFLIIPQYGILGAAYVTFFSYLLLCVLVLSFSLVHTKRMC